MSRSLKKGPYVDVRLLAKVERVGTREPIKTWARDCTIVPEFVGATFLAHNGKQPRRPRNIDELGGVESRIDGAPMLRRIQPRASGTAYPIKKRYAHIVVCVGDETENGAEE